MTMLMVDASPHQRLLAAFGERVQFDVPLARYTAARIGGPAEALLTVESVAALTETAETCWSEGFSFRMLGAGSNVLVSDAGLTGLTVINKARAVRFEQNEAGHTVWAESGANFGAIARAAAGKGLSGLEWAAGIPGTLGGAVVGNAGAHGGDTAGNLVWAEVLFRDEGELRLSAAELGFDYRRSRLKADPGNAVVLAAVLRLEPAPAEEIEARMAGYLAHRRRTQPPGASMGSMFKNPPGDFAGRLIDAAGMKGMQVGGAQISPLHGNFFLNRGGASAAEVLALIEQARRTVAEKFGILLELEIELLGDMAGAVND